MDHFKDFQGFGGHTTYIGSSIIDHFKDFQGFGRDGHYLGYWKEDVVETARRILSENRGKKVILQYSESFRGWKNHIKYDPSKIFTPHEDRITVPKNGSLGGFLEGVLTDNIEIEIVGKEKKVFEVQRIVIGDQYVSELRMYGW